MDELRQRDRLASLVRSRRMELGLSVSKAAQAAGIDRATWTYLENGSRRTAEFNYAGIERALQWKAGSIGGVLGGRQPELAAPEPEVDEELELVRTDPRLTSAMKEKIIGLILERRERDRASAIEDTRRMIDLFRRG
ncbi:helix-turn-helix transcriptional regulator [Micromonospora sp. WMMA1363]|uniref:helix-turn-helix domain-containing protein n=1 Tax=Micromonospora sp. WMMA1363 TaxID=3053985 RepID=UPI00259D21AD|nr:helix-turn-helix transcriptional regulator [Micromonospora sp. WMMA1363]MDM4722792.1 helix-turn-helix transcriptional regulator [Micromonospora sp. WMMA1363]